MSGGAAAQLAADPERIELAQKKGRRLRRSVPSQIDKWEPQRSGVHNARAPGLAQQRFPDVIPVPHCPGSKVASAG